MPLGQIYPSISIVLRWNYNMLNKFINIHTPIGRCVIHSLASTYLFHHERFHFRSTKTTQEKQLALSCCFAQVSYLQIVIFAPSHPNAYFCVYMTFISIKNNFENMPKISTTPNQVHHIARVKMGIFLERIGPSYTTSQSLQ